LTIKSISAICFAWALILPVAVDGQCHGHGQASSGSAGTAVRSQSPNSGASTGALIQSYGDVDWTVNLEDSIGLLMDFYSRISRTLTPDGNEGGALGTGGKDRVFPYSPADSGATLKDSLKFRINQNTPGGFSYLPLWPVTVISGRIDARLKNSWKVSAAFYIPPVDKKDSSLFSMGELNTSLFLVKGLLLKAGRFYTTGSYYPVFDQDFLGSYNIDGIGVRYTRSLSADAVSESEISAGRNVSYAEKQRHAVIKSRVIFSDRYQCRIMAGIQLANADSASGIPAGYLYNGDRFGWHAGIEALHHSGSFTHKLAFIYGAGDVLTGAGAPPSVRFEKTVANANDSTERRYFFSGKGSAISGLIYGLAYYRGLFMLEAGVTALAFLPAASRITEKNPNSSVPDDFLLANGLPTGDSVKLNPDAYYNAKISIQPSFQVNKWLNLALRYDHLQYFTPQAKGNWQGVLFDAAQRPIYYPGNSRILYGPAKWEWEPVNADILSPQVNLTLGDWVHLSASYSKGFYDKDILRQGVVSDRHSNFSILVLVNAYFLRKLGDYHKSEGKSAPADKPAPEERRDEDID